MKFIYKLIILSSIALFLEPSLARANLSKSWTSGWESPVNLKIKMTPQKRLVLEISAAIKDKPCKLPAQIIIESVIFTIDGKLSHGGGNFIEIKIPQDELANTVSIDITPAMKNLAYFVGRFLTGNEKRPIMAMTEGEPVNLGENWQPMNLDIDKIKTFSFYFSISGFGKNRGQDISTNSLPLTKGELKDLLKKYSITANMGSDKF